jgi:hypothetical protein
VLLVLGNLLKGFEEARQRHRPAESQNTLHPRDRATLPTLSPPPTQTPTRRGNMWRSERPPVGKASAGAIASESEIATPATTLVSVDDFAQSQIEGNFVTLEHHFHHNINAAWQKLNDYYTRTDDTLIYRATVFLYPRLKWRWFERYWESKPQWITAAREAVTDL